MAQYTKHPVSAPPTAPERESTGHLLLRGYVILVLVIAFAHSAVYNLLGQTGAALTLVVFTLATAAIGVPMLARNRPQPFRWRRLPWAALGYTALALLSIVWSQWRGPTLITWFLLAAITVNGLFIAHVLTWHEIVRALSSAFKWILGLSLAIELWVSLVLHGPLLPNFATLPDGKIDPQWYWVRDNLFDGGRIQGIVGNANLLAMISLFALITFGVLFAARARWRTTLALWMLLAVYFLFRTSSATALACAAAVVVTLAVALLMRHARTPGARTRIYVVAIGGTVLAVAAVWLLRGPLLALLGRDVDLTGRSDLIWAKVLQRAGEHPIIGNGFSSPWVPTDPAFDHWITDHGITVFHAHNMWLDVLLQLGALGVVVMAVAYGSLLWRSWFFAVDRPRWDLDAARPYSPLTLLPSLFTVTLLVQGLSESTPIMLWGWLLLVLLSFKLKSVPLVGVGERDLVFERGARQRRVP
ncbi:MULTISPECIES: O-antigen ligase [Microbacterium]|uniref:O-antigen ligase family protein n=1 Tax=Microbacterium algeriense TaxID=2615184 RepID=A0ABQ6V4Y8_9MICO|nr:MULTISPECIES: O-antigen ligase family protein [Microbacterium]AZH78122.1 ligase [Microbacterium sp. Y-01]KAB1864250.1 O-antigen ligase family protein [Microbacterium algeriense]MDX2398465.1 O-antigen ligase family protein [Microbacterium algeriense]